MGALPWPTIFTSITALVLLRAVGRTSLNEANVTQIIMSAGSMVAGGLAFTIPSVYTALKMGALPWPTIFTSITALVLLRAVGRTSLNEANVTQIIMSAGSMVAGGLAFTIPGVWMLGLGAELSWIEIGGVALAGTLLGLVCTALIWSRAGWPSPSPAYGCSASAQS